MPELVTIQSRNPGRGSGNDQFLAAYVDILFSDGVAGANLDELARQADISMRELLHHFPAMEDWVSAVLTWSSVFMTWPNHRRE